MKKKIALGGQEVEINFKNLKKGDRFGDWVYSGNSTQPGNPLWSEFYNIKTGESTIKNHEPKTVMSADGCSHHYEPIDDYGNVMCTRCEDGRKIVRGFHLLEDGKIIQIRKPEPLQPNS